MTGNRFFFGWWVLLGIFISYMALVGIQVYTLPLFYPALMKEYGWSTENVTIAATIFYLTGAILTPFVSLWFDRYSARIFMIVGGLLTIAGLFFYRSIHTLTQMSLIYMIFALSQVCCGQVPTILVVTRWFKRYRGMAVAVTLTGTSIGGAVFPLVVRSLLAADRWRDALLLLIPIAGGMILLPLIFIIRDRPEDKGLGSDGDPVKEMPGPTGTPSQQAGPTLKQAVRMPAFYILAFATGSLWFCMNGIVQHQTIFMNIELGVPMDTVPVIVSAIFWFAIIGKILTGYMSDRYDRTLIMFVVVLFLVGGLILLRLSSASNLLGLYSYAAVFGIGYAGTFTMIQVVIAEFFSGPSFGKILGILSGIDVGAGGIAITVIAQVQGGFHSYLPVFEMLIVLTCIVAAMVLFLRRMPRCIVQKTAA